MVNNERGRKRKCKQRDLASSACRNVDLLCEDHMWIASNENKFCVFRPRDGPSIAQRPSLLDSGTSSKHTRIGNGDIVDEFSRVFLAFALAAQLSLAATTVTMFSFASSGSKTTKESKEQHKHEG